MARVLPVTVAVLLLLAGCSATPSAGTPGPDTATVTPAPVPESATSVPTDTVVAPGVNSEGGVDPIALSRAHERALAGNAYILSANLTVRNATGAILTDRTFLTRASTTHRIKHTRITASGPDARFYGSDRSTAIWQIGREKYQVIDGPNQTEYRELAPWESIRPSLVAPPGAAVFLITSAMATDEPTRQAGQPVVLTGDRLRSPALLATAAGVGDPTNATLRAVIWPDGLVRSYTLRFGGTADNRPVRFSLSVRYSRVGHPGIGPPTPPANLTG